MADISKIKLPDNSEYDIKDATARAQSGVTGVKGNSESSYRTGNVNLTPDNIGAVAKTTYEYNKEKSFGSSGKLLIGKFPCYDTNVTIEINSTTSTTYHAVAVLATQNVNNSHGGTITWNVYGDDSNTVAPNLYLYYPTDSRWIEIYFSPTAWSKNLIHIQCIGLLDPDSQRAAQRAGESPQETQIIFVHTACETSAYQRPAVADEPVQALRNPGPEHVQHRRGNQPVFSEIAVFINNVHIQAKPFQGTVMVQHRIHILFIPAGPGASVDSPAIVGVKYQRRPGVGHGTVHFRQPV